MANKNYKFDFADTEIKFGNWVAQDSFHLKAFYVDIFRWIANIGYKYYESVLKYTGLRSNRFHFGEYRQDSSDNFTDNILNSNITDYMNATGDFDKEHKE